MAVTSRVEVLEALAKGEFDRLIGTPEGQQIEFKEKAYDLGVAKGGRDLVADVAAFANARGGVIVLGIRTAAEPTTRQEVASAVCGTDPSSVDDDAYEKRIREHVHPLVKDFEIRRYRNATATRDVVAINVEAQGRDEGPFIVDRVAAMDQERDLPHAIGWPTRSGADTHWERPARLQQLVSIGARPANRLPTAEPAPSVTDEMDAHHVVIDELDDWDRWAVFIVQIVGEAPLAIIDDFFGKFCSDARAWRGVRPKGFNLGLEWSPLTPAGNRLVANSQRAAVVVGRSGEVTAAGSTYPGFFGWAQHTDGTWDSLDRLIVNPYVLVEFTTEVLRFAYDFVGQRTAPAGWQLRVQWLHLLDRVPVELRETVGIGPPFATEVQRARVADLSLELQGTGDAGRDAFELVAEVYGQGFGLGRDAVPFAKDGRIDLGLMSSS